MATLFKTILYQPLLNLVVLIYNFLPRHDFGLAIIGLTVLIRLAFFPLSIKTIRSQKAMAELAPKLNEIKEKHKNDQSAQSAAIMSLYKENNINPLSGCLPLVIQIPVLIALYRAFLTVAKAGELTSLYGFVANPGAINRSFLGIIDIAARSPYLAVLAGVLQFGQAWLSSRSQAASPVKGAPDLASSMNKQMLYFFPVMIIIISWNLPAGLTLYWVTTTAFSIIEQLYVRRPVKAVPNK